MSDTDQTEAKLSVAAPLAPGAPHPKGRIESIHNLRGIASLTVLFDHLVASAYVGAPAVVVAMGILGNYGVTIFFFISGFVLPWSLMKTKYRVQDFPMFIARRFVRVDPPFFVIVGATLALNILLGYVKHAPYHIDGVQLLGHIAYIAPLLHKPWLSSVFWTLCTEFQFYIMIGLCFPLLKRYPIPLAIACAACMWAYVPGYFPTDRLPLGQREVIFAYLPSFMIGMATFLHKAELANFRTCAVAVAISAIALAFKAPIDIAIVGVLMIFVVTYMSFYNRALSFFGDISYSLYLFHPLVILTVLPALGHFGIPWPVMFAIGAAVSIVGAALMYRFVEGPALALSKRVRLKPRQVQSVPALPVAESGA